MRIKVNWKFIVMVKHVLLKMVNAYFIIKHWTVMLYHLAISHLISSNESHTHLFNFIKIYLFSLFKYFELWKLEK